MNAHPIFVIAFVVNDTKKVRFHFIPSFLNSNMFIGISIIKVIANMKTKYIIKYELIN